MKTLLIILGVISVAIGALWIGQGTGYINWPEASSMINETKWAYYGVALAVIGVIAIWYSRRGV